MRDMSKCHQISGFGVSNHGKLLSELSFVITNNNQSSGAKFGAVDFFARYSISGDSYRSALAPSEYKLWKPPGCQGYVYVNHTLLKSIPLLLLSKHPKVLNKISGTVTKYAPIKICVQIYLC